MDHEWGTLAFEVPDFLEAARNDINTVAEALVTALDIALIALNLAKAFLIGLIDPIAALVQALINEIEGFLRDLQQLGVYITGDWKLMKWPYQDLVGGFDAYERRMIARLTDQTDPTRPDLPPTTAVMSIFFYLSVDISDIQKLVRFLMQLIQFFNQSYNPPGGKPVPVITEVNYGSAAASSLQPMSLPDFFDSDQGDAPPNIVQVKWKVPPPVQKNPNNPFPPLPPGGFLVTVSTIRDGIQVVYDRPQANAGKVKDITGKGSQPREYGVVRDVLGRPLVLHGGLDTFYLPDSLGYNQAIDAGKLKDGVSRIYGKLADGTLIPLEDLSTDIGGEKRVFFQKTFLVPIANVATQWATSEYMITLNAKDMPITGTIQVNSDGTISIINERETSNFYVRVASTTTGIGDGTDTYQYDLAAAAPALNTPPSPVVASMIDIDTEVSDTSVFSNPRTITFPSTFAKQYLETVQAALVVLFLSRPDLVPLDTLGGVLTKEQKDNIASKKMLLNNVALERCGLEGVQQLTGYLYKDYSAMVEKKNVPVVKGFRQDLLNQVQRVAHQIYSETGPIPAAEEAIVQQTQELREVTWGQIFKEVHPGIYNSLSSTGDMDSMTLLWALSEYSLNRGLGLNPYSMGMAEEAADNLFTIPNVIQDRDPQMMEGQIGQGDPTFQTKLLVPASEAKAYLDTLSPALLPIYEKCIQSDGSIVVDPGYSGYINNLGTNTRTEGSADLSPVFFVNRDGLESWSPGTQAGVYYCRGLFAKYKHGELLRQAALTLSVAGSRLVRSPEDGEWIALRFFDQFPSWQEFLAQLVNWMKAVQKSLKSVVDTILKYIEFVEARIVELQQLINRINALLQLMLGYAFHIPKCSALFNVSNGTSGVLTDLVTAKGKPEDSPLAYGAGICVVIPVGPVLVMDIYRAIFVSEDGAPQPGETLGSSTLPFPAAVGIEGLPPVPVPPDTGPDVL